MSNLKVYLPSWWQCGVVVLSLRTGPWRWSWKWVTQLIPTPDCLCASFDVKICLYVCTSLLPRTTAPQVSHLLLLCTWVAVHLCCLWCTGVGICSQSGDLHSGFAMCTSLWFYCTGTCGPRVQEGQAPQFGTLELELCLSGKNKYEQLLSGAGELIFDSFGLLQQQIAGGQLFRLSWCLWLLLSIGVD